PASSPSCFGGRHRKPLHRRLPSPVAEGKRESPGSLVCYGTTEKRVPCLRQRLPGSGRPIQHPHSCSTPPSIGALARCSGVLASPRHCPSCSLWAPTVASVGLSCGAWHIPPVRFVCVPGLPAIPRPSGSTRSTA